MYTDVAQGEKGFGASLIMQMLSIRYAHADWRTELSESTTAAQKQLQIPLQIMLLAWLYQVNKLM